MVIPFLFRMHIYFRQLFLDEMNIVISINYKLGIKNAKMLFISKAKILLCCLVISWKIQAIEMENILTQME